MTVGARDYKERHSAVDAVAVDVSAADQAVAVGARGVYVGGAGDLVVTLIGGTTVTFKSIPAGTVLPIVPKTIVKLSTTVTNSLILF